MSTAPLPREQLATELRAALGEMLRAERKLRSRRSGGEGRDRDEDQQHTRHVPMMPARR